MKLFACHNGLLVKLRRSRPRECDQARYRHGDDPPRSLLHRCLTLLTPAILLLLCVAILIQVLGVLITLFHPTGTDDAFLNALLTGYAALAATAVVAVDPGSRLTRTAQRLSPARRFQHTIFLPPVSIVSFSKPIFPPTRGGVAFERPPSRWREKTGFLCCRMSSEVPASMTEDHRGRPWQAMIQTMSIRREIMSQSFMTYGKQISCWGLLWVLSTPPAFAAVPATPTAPHNAQRVTASLLGTPLHFEANHGQVDGQVKFISRGSGYTLFLTPTESVMVLRSVQAKGERHEAMGNDPFSPLALDPLPVSQSVVRMKLEGANPSPAIDGLEQLPGIVNYFIGNDPAKWRTKIPTYAKVQYKDAYPGIDLAYYGNQGKLEYDFIVAPGADPNQIKLAFDGASDIKVADSGDLLLTTALGEVRVQKPIVYQLEADGHKTLVAGNYLASPMESHTVGIQLAAYDHSKPLVIDPVLVYSSFIGSSADDLGTDIIVDDLGNTYVAGYAGGSLNIPAAGAPYDSTHNGGNDVFILKIDPVGTVLVWTYLGGAFNDHSPSLALDQGGNVWVSGTTGGSTFPIITSSAIQTTYAGGGDGFISKFDSSLTNLQYSTFYGGAGGDGLSGIAVDASGTVIHVVGNTTSTTLPGVTSSSIQSAYGGGTYDGFYTKINVALKQIEYATYLGGSDRDELHQVRVDLAGNVHVVGMSWSDNFPGTRTSSIPALASFQPDFGGAIDAVVAKLNPTGTQLTYSTYLGGSGNETGYGLVLDSAGNAVVSGNTGSLNFPLAGTPFQSTRVAHDYYVTKLNSSGTALIMSTLFGGVGDDFGSVVALDQSDNIYLTGPTYSCRIPNFSHPLQIDRCGLGAPFIHVPVAKLDAAGSNLLALTVFTGSSGISGASSIAVDTRGNVHVAGATRADDFTTLNAFQETHGGGSASYHYDGFVAKILIKPIANAGPDQTVPMGTLVTLDGTGSTGGSLSYQWSYISGPSVALGSANTAHPTFTAPTVPAAGGTVTLQLIVCEGSSNCSDPDTVNVHITNVNQPPVAEAGADQTVQEGSAVILNGTASYDPDIEDVTYHWTQISGPAVTLANADTAMASFAAPSVGAGGDTLVFDLTVTDARNLTGSDPISVFVTNVNQAPVAHAGPDQTKNENTLVTLDGSGSSDPDLDALSYSWTQIGGLSVPLTGGTTASPTFTAPTVGAGGGLLTFQLTVHDGHTGSAPDTVQIVIQNVNDPPVCALAQASPTLLWPPNHTMVPVSIAGITDPANSAITITYTAVTQDEPISGLGDGDVSPDAAVSGNNILLRAERAGTGNGRVYVVDFTATNADGESCNGTVRVSVPHSKKDPAGEGSQLYNSFGP